MRSHRTALLLLKAFALVCVSIRGLAIDGSEGAFLRQVESGSVPGSSQSPDARHDLFDVLGTSMTYLAMDGPHLTAPGRSGAVTRAACVRRADPRAEPLLKPPCA